MQGQPAYTVKWVLDVYGEQYGNGFCIFGILLA
jgi:hypothetical protein